MSVLFWLKMDLVLLRNHHNPFWSNTSVVQSVPARIIQVRFGSIHRDWWGCVVLALACIRTRFLHFSRFSLVFSDQWYEMSLPANGSELLQ